MSMSVSKWGLLYMYYVLGSFFGVPLWPLPPLCNNVVYGRPPKLLSIHLMIGQLNFRFTTSLLTTGSHLRCQQYKNRPWCLFWMWCQIQSQTLATWMVAQCKLKFVHTSYFIFFEDGLNQVWIEQTYITYFHILYKVSLLTFMTFSFQSLRRMYIEF